MWTTLVGWRERRAAAAFVVALLTGCAESTSPPGNEELPPPAPLDTVWLTRPDQSGRLILPLLKSWAFRATLVPPFADPAGFASVEVLQDTIYPGYPLDPNAFRVFRAELGTGVIRLPFREVAVVAPIAVDDTGRIATGLALTIPVTENDRKTSGPGSGSIVISIAQPSHGFAEITAAATGIRYTSTAGFAGTDTLWYVVRDVLSQKLDTALVRVFVMPGPYRPVTLGAAGQSFVVRDIANFGWTAGTATMAEGSTRPVRWHDEVAEVLPLPAGAVNGTGEFVSDSGAVYGVVDGAPMYWPAGSTTAIAVPGGATVVAMNGNGDLLITKPDPGQPACRVAGIWNVSSLKFFPRAYPGICSVAARSVNNARDILYVLVGSGISSFSIRDSVHGVVPFQSGTTLGTYNELNDRREVVGSTMRRSASVTGYDGAMVTSPATFLPVSVVYAQWITEVARVNNRGWMIGCRCTGPIASLRWALLVGGATFPAEELLDASAPLTLESLQKVADDGRLLATAGPDHRRVVLQPLTPVLGPTPDRP